ncbi:MAG: small metal-binding protein SmbP [Gammaproteobacteria bacterium]
MKTITTHFGIFSTTLLLLVGSVAVAGDHHGAYALEHAAVAATHAEKGHLELLLEHSKEALHHAQMSAQTHHDRQMHMAQAVKKLELAIDQANEKQSELAAQSARQAVEHIHQSFD